MSHGVFYESALRFEFDTADGTVVVFLFRVFDGNVGVELALLVEGHPAGGALEREAKSVPLDVEQEVRPVADLPPAQLTFVGLFAGMDQLVLFEGDSCGQHTAAYLHEE